MTMRWGVRLPLFWPGIAAVAFFFLLVLLQGLGLRLGSPDSLLSAWLTCAGLTLAWGHLMAGASAGGWAARLAVVLALGFTLYPVRQPLLTGYAGLVLLAGIVAFLVWRWRQPAPLPVADLLVPGVIILLTYGVVADRSALFTQARGGGEALFPLFLGGQLVFLYVFAGTLLLFAGASLGDAALLATRRLMARLTLLPAGRLAAGCVGLGGLKLLWDLSRSFGAGWISGLLLAAAVYGWFRLAAPAGHWSARRPGIVLALGMIFILAFQFGPGLFRPGTPSPQLFTAALHLTMLAALVTAGAALALGRRPLVFFAGLVGIYLAFASSDGVTASPIPVLSLLHHLPKMETGVIDGLLHLALTGRAAWLWLRGQRDGRPFAFILSIMAVLLGMTAIDLIYDTPALRQSPLTLLLFAAAAVYCLWQIFRGAARQQGQAAAMWAGLGMGGALLLFAAAYWTQNSDLREMYAASLMPPLGYAIFGPIIYGTGLVQFAQELEVEGRAAA